MKRLSAFLLFLTISGSVAFATRDIPDDPNDPADCTLLFQEGQTRLKAGKYGTAIVAFRTLISVYPESGLVKPATEAMHEAEQQERAHAQIVQAVRFEKIKRVPAKDILDRFKEREIGLTVQGYFNPNQAAEAKEVLTELLKERGMANPRVRVDVRAVNARDTQAHN